MYCHICNYCGYCQRKKVDEAQWRYPQGVNDDDTLSNWNAWENKSEPASDEIKH